MIQQFLIGLAVPLTLACIAIIIYGIIISIKELVVKEVKKQLEDK